MSWCSMVKKKQSTGKMIVICNFKLGEYMEPRGYLQLKHLQGLSEVKPYYRYYS